MEVIQTGLKGLIEIRPRVFSDDRGWFMETYNQSRYSHEYRVGQEFVQDNLSRSALHTLRGIHFQAPPYAQSKLVMVISGKALDVAVDLRKNSATYGQHYKVILNAKDKNQLFLPQGFGHGFLALEPDTLFLYKCDNDYSKAHERTLLWNDPDLGIDWGIQDPIVSQKDTEGDSFEEFITPFD